MKSWGALSSPKVRYSPNIGLGLGLELGLGLGLGLG